jgi:hypothetical protein
VVLLVLLDFFDFGEAPVDVGEVVAQVGVYELVGLAVLVVFVVYFFIAEI